MISSSLLLFIAKDNDFSNEITQEFVKDHNVIEIAKELSETKEPKEIDGFTVVSMIVEIEETFVKLLQSLGQMQGFIHIGTIETPYLQVGDLAEVKQYCHFLQDCSDQDEVVALTPGENVIYVETVGDEEEVEEEPNDLVS